MITARASQDTFAQYRELRTSQSSLIRAKEDLLDEETSVRGYDATGDRVFLEPFPSARAHMITELSRFRALGLGGGYPEAVAVAAQLSAIQQQWLARVGIPGSQSARLTIAQQLAGKKLVDRFRAIEFTTERRMADKIRALFGDMNDRIRATTLYSALLIAIGAVIVAVASIAAGRSQRRRREDTQIRMLIETMPQIVFVTDATGKAIYFNQRCYDYTGLTEEQALGDGWANAIHPDDIARTVSRWEACIRSGEAYEIEYRIRSASGVYHWFVGRALPEREESGRIVRWLGTCTDVDAQHTQLESVQRVADAFAQAQLPESLPNTPHVAFDATYLPAEDIAQVGGDWYDAFALDADHYFFSVGDVTGHGLDAALLMSRVRQAILAFASVGNDPAAILERTNRVLRIQREDMVTALCGIFNARTGLLHYASAGHPPSLILRAGGEIVPLSSAAPPLGVLDQIRVLPVQVHLAPSERLVCYTDGIIENERDVIGGEMHLRGVLRALTPFENAEPARAIRERILGGRRGRDDVAILVLTRLDPAGVSLSADEIPAAAGKG